MGIHIRHEIRKGSKERGCSRTGFLNVFWSRMPHQETHWEIHENAIVRTERETIQVGWFETDIKCHFRDLVVSILTIWIDWISLLYWEIIFKKELTQRVSGWLWLYYENLYVLGEKRSLWGYFLLPEMWFLPSFYFFNTFQLSVYGINSSKQLFSQYLLFRMSY